MRKQYEAEKEELTRQIGQLTIEVNWLKKNLQKSTSAAERRETLSPWIVNPELRIEA